MPGKVQPIDFRIGLKALLPVQLCREFQALFVTGTQIQAGDLRALGIDLTLQQ